MKTGRSHMGMRVAALLMAILMAVPLFGGMLTPMPASAATQKEINALKGSANDLKAQKKQINEKLKEIRADKSKAVEQKKLLDQREGVIQAEIENIDQRISAYSNLISEKEEEIKQAQEKERQQYELFCQRVRYMEEEGEISYWSILFSASDFSDLLDNFMMVEEIIEFDNQVMDQLVETRKKIESDKATLEVSIKEQQSAKQEQEERKAELKSQQAEADSVVKEIKAQEDALEAAARKLNAAAAAMDAEIRKLEKEMSQQVSNVVSESGFMWPLPGHNTLSSLFGKRIHPITGKPNNHTGIDIPAPSGTAIRASKSGVVITSNYNGSYGNYVVVAHSDGTSTLYAHMSRRNAAKGQTVKQGATIGYVGTTGSSNGNHLHYEIRVNGGRVDPVSYFKNMTLYVTYGGQKVLLKH